MPSANASDDPRGPTRTALRQLVCPARWVFGGKQSNRMHPHTNNGIQLPGVLLRTGVRPALAYRAVYSWCMHLHIVTILTEHTSKYFVQIMYIRSGDSFYILPRGPPWFLVWDCTSELGRWPLRCRQQAWSAGGPQPFYHVPRLMCIVDWNEVLWIFVFYEVF